MPTIWRRCKRSFARETAPENHLPVDISGASAPMGASMNLRSGPRRIRSPYLVMLGDTSDPTYAKTGLGIRQWQPERVIGQLRFNSCKVDLGVADLTPAQAREQGACSLVVGVAPAGGGMSEHWWNCLDEAARAGLDIVAGLHVRLAERPSLVRIAEQHGVKLIDVREPPTDLPVADGRKRRGLRLLTDMPNGNRQQQRPTVCQNAANLVWVHIKGNRLGQTACDWRIEVDETNKYKPASRYKQQTKHPPYRLGRRGRQRNGIIDGIKDCKPKQQTRNLWQAKR